MNKGTSANSVRHSCLIRYRKRNDGEFKESVTMGLDTGGVELFGEPGMEDADVDVRLSLPLKEEEICFSGRASRIKKKNGSPCGDMRIDFRKMDQGDRELICQYISWVQEARQKVLKVKGEW